MKKKLAVLLALAMAFTLVAGCGDSSTSESSGTNAVTVKDIYTEEVKIAFIPMSTSGAVTSIVQQSADAVMAAYPNLQINFLDCGHDPTTQISLINECVTDGYGAIIIESTDTTAVCSAVNDAEASGVPVITLNCDCDTVHTLFLKNNSYDAGQVAAKGLVEGLEEKGNILILDVPYSMVATSNFTEGFEDYVADYPDIAILDHQYISGDSYSQEGAFTLMSNMLTKYDDVDAIYAPDDDFAIGCAQAIKAAGRSDEGILIWGNDCMPAGIDAIRDGTMYGTSYADRYSTAFAMFVSALNLIQTGTTAASLGYDATPVVYVTFTGVTAANVDSIAKYTHWEGY